MDNRWETLEHWVRRALATATLIGGLIIFLYLTLIGFFPTSLSVGSALVFIFVAVISGLALFAFVGLGVAFVYGVRVTITKQTTVLVLRLGGFMIALSSGALIWFLSPGQHSYTKSWGIFTALVFGMLIYNCRSFFETWKARKTLPSDLTRTTNFLLTMLFLSILSEGLLPNLLWTMRVVGLRFDSVTIYLSKNNFDKVADAAKDFHLAIFPCEVNADRTRKRLDETTVLWHGIGERSLISIPYSKSVPGQKFFVPKAARLELDSSGVTIVRIEERYREPVPRCYRSSIEINKELLQGPLASRDKVEGFFEQSKNIASLRNFSYQTTLVRCANELEVNSIKAALAKFFRTAELVSVDDSGCAGDSRTVMLELILNDPSERPIDYIGLD